MATVTPNFNWPVPTSTDLVKDGATAIEALGDSIDASLVDLKGGTTGQVLSKTSNTDMDFTWVAADDTNAIQNTIVDAKGDLIAASAADTPARLAVGNNGETLVADSSTSTGLRYQATQAAGKNYFINGGFDVWQRGTSFTPTSAAFNYSADRWYVSLASGTSGVTMSQSTDAATGFRYSLKTQRTAGVTATPAIYTIQAIETVNSIPLAGQTVTLSMWVKKGANWSGTVYSNNLYTGTGADQGGFPSIWTGAANPLGINIVPTTSWVRYSATGTLSSAATQIGLLSQWSGVGTAGADDSLYVTGVQLEIGAVATQFTRAGGTIQGELAACQRYYFRFGGDATNQHFATGMSDTAVAAQIFLYHPVTMRANPTVLDFSALQITDNANYALTVTTASIAIAAKNGTELTIGNNTGATANRTAFLRTSSTSGYLGLGAEL
jgi:hypothetical protein